MMRTTASARRGDPAAWERPMLDPVNCQKQVNKNPLKFNEDVLEEGREVRRHPEHRKDLRGPCPDPATQLKIQTVAGDDPDQDRASCVRSPISRRLGFPTSCDVRDDGATGIEGTCAGAAGHDAAAELAACLMRWKGAELAEFLAVLYAVTREPSCAAACSTRPRRVCSDLDCTTPLPNQLDLGDTGENDCQKAIGKAGIKHLVSIEKVLEKCGLLGNDRATCLADLVVQTGITEVADQARHRHPQQVRQQSRSDPDPPFCCQHRPAATRACGRDLANGLRGQPRGHRRRERRPACAGSCDAGMRRQPAHHVVEHLSDRDDLQQARSTRSTS